MVVKLPMSDWLLKSGNLSQQSCRHKSWTRSVVWGQPPAPVLAPVVDWVWLKLVLGWNNKEKLLFHDKDVQYICDQVGILILISSTNEDIDIELQKSDRHISEVTWNVPGAIRGSPYFMNHVGIIFEYRDIFPRNLVQLRSSFHCTGLWSCHGFLFLLQRNHPHLETQAIGLFGIKKDNRDEGNIFRNKYSSILFLRTWAGKLVFCTIESS